MASSGESSSEILREHNAILRQVVTEHGGTEVRNVDDHFTVVFVSASAALACAVAMQQGVDLNNQKQHRASGLRIGISAGEVVRDDTAYVGDCVVEAERLWASCKDGQVLAAEVVRLMAGRRSTHECRPVGSLRLEGLPEPVDAIEVMWQPLEGEGAVSRIPLPARLEVAPIELRRSQRRTAVDRRHVVAGVRRSGA